MTYEAAVNNQWAVCQHRIAYSKEHGKPCKCSDCLEHFAAIEAHDTTVSGKANGKAQ